MADQEWLKNLSQASYAGGVWQHEDPGAVRQLAAERLGRATTDLAELARDYGDTLNDVARGRRAVRVLDIAPKGESAGGFMLLLGRCQLNLELKDQLLEATLVTVQGFQRVPRRLYRFVPHVDPFGSLAWSLDNALLMTGELIIKRLFEDVTRAACEAGEIR